MASCFEHKKTVYYITDQIMSNPHVQFPIFSDIIALQSNKNLGKLTAGTQKSWRWMEDAFPFSIGSFLGSTVKFSGGVFC